MSHSNQTHREQSFLVTSEKVEMSDWDPELTRLLEFCPTVIILTGKEWSTDLGNGSYIIPVVVLHRIVYYPGHLHSEKRKVWFGLIFLACSETKAALNSWLCASRPVLDPYSPLEKIKSMNLVVQTSNSISRG